MSFFRSLCALKIPTLRSLPRCAFRKFSPSWASTKSDSFDGEISKLYATVFMQHAHENGPWKRILEATKSAIPSGKGKVLDLASGAGEPGLTIAQAMPGNDRCY